MARLLASKATLHMDVSGGHWSSDGQQPPGHISKSLVLSFEVTFALRGAAPRRLAGTEATGGPSAVDDVAPPGLNRGHCSG